MQLSSPLNVTGIATMAALAGGWEAAVRGRLVDFEFLPAPSAVLAAGLELAAAGALLPAFAHTLGVTLLGWAIATVLGLGLGLLLGLSTTAHRFSITSFEVTRAVPPITLVPAAILLFGFSIRMELAIAVYAGMWPLLINTLGGVRQVPTELLDVARMLRLSRVRTVTRIILPAVLPAVVVGLRLALSLCLVLTVVAEMIGNPAGLGHALVRARLAIQPEQMFAYVLVIGLLGISLNGGLRAVAAVTLPAANAGGEGRPW